jgi:IS30 family transposase
MQGQHGHLSTEQKQMAFRLYAHGWRLIDIGREIGCTAPMVGRMVREHKHVDGHPFGWEPRAGCLTIFEREQIMVGIGGGESLSAIARDLGRSASTITREVNANGGRDEYSAWRAHERAREEARRPKPCKLRRGKLLREVTRRLEQLWSPEEIARRLPLDYPDDEEMRVSHETIYQSLFVQGGGELRRELARCLRSGRTARRARGSGTRRPGRLPDMVMISERPAEVDDRAVPGHWEGDIVLGQGGRSAVGTLVERTTRFVLLLSMAIAPPMRSMPPCAKPSPPCPTSSAGPSPGTKARRWPTTSISRSPPTSPSISATRTHHGNAGRMRTPTASCANTSPRASIFRRSAQPNSARSNAASTAGLARPLVL